jgi:hypothetical protein
MESNSHLMVIQHWVWWIFVKHSALTNWRNHINKMLVRLLLTRELTRNHVVVTTDTIKSWFHQTENICLFLDIWAIFSWDVPPMWWWSGFLGNWCINLPRYHGDVVMWLRTDQIKKRPRNAGKKLILNVQLKSFTKIAKHCKLRSFLPIMKNNFFENNFPIDGLFPTVWHFVY